MLPEIAKNQLCRVYRRFFAKQAISLWPKLNKLWKRNCFFGLKAKIHVQFNRGIQAAIKYNALSVDHLEVMKRRYYRLKKIQNHAGSATIPFYF
jgi:imidazolonepropionase